MHAARLCCLSLKMVQQAAVSVLVVGLRDADRTNRVARASIRPPALSPLESSSANSRCTCRVYVVERRGCASYPVSRRFPNTNQPEREVVSRDKQARNRAHGVADRGGMVMAAHTNLPETLDDVREFVDSGRTTDPQHGTRAAVYRFIEETAQRFDHVRLGRADKGVLRRYLCRVTGLSRAQVTRLLRRYRNGERLADHRRTPARPFSRRYTSADVELLAEVDALHGTLSGPATPLRAGSAPARITSSAISSSNGWRASPTVTCTT